MSTLTLPLSYRPRAYALGRRAVTLLIWIGALLWLLPVLVAAWVALHPAAEQSSFSPSAP